MGATLSGWQPANPGEGWTTEPTEGEPWLDVAAVQRKLDAIRQRGYTLHRAFFRVPADCVDTKHFERYWRLSVSKWLRTMESKGYVLRGRVQTFGPFAATSESGGWYTTPALGEREYRVLAAFSNPSARPKRIELPVAVVKRS